MNAYVAVSAVLVPGIGHVMRLRERRDARPAAPECPRAVMALQAQGEDNRPPQQPRIGRTVRIMARFAAFNAHGRMLEGERAALIGVALETGFLVCERLIDHRGSCGHAPGRRECPVRIVAIGTSHEPLLHGMLKRHRKLGTDIGVAAVAQLRLALGQKELRRGGLMN